MDTVNGDGQRWHGSSSSRPHHSRPAESKANSGREPSGPGLGAQEFDPCVGNPFSPLRPAQEEDPTTLQSARTSVSTTDNGSWRERMTHAPFKIEEPCLRSCVSLSISLASFVSAGRRRAMRESRGKCDRKEEKEREMSEDARLLCLPFAYFHPLVSGSPL